MTKLLDGRELSGYIKERQRKTVLALKSRKISPKLLILRDNDSPVIEKYVALKKKYGDDIKIKVEDKLAKDADELKKLVLMS